MGKRWGGGQGGIKSGNMARKNDSRVYGGGI